MFFTWGATLGQFLIGPTETFLGDFIWIERLLKMIANDAQLATSCWDPSAAKIQSPNDKQAHDAQTNAVGAVVATVPLAQHRKQTACSLELDSLKAHAGNCCTLCWQPWPRAFFSQHPWVTTSISLSARPLLLIQFWPKNMQTQHTHAGQAVTNYTDLRNSLRHFETSLASSSLILPIT